MKSPFRPAICAIALMGFALITPSPVAANPLSSIGSGIKKVGKALNPFKKNEPKPAAEAPPPPKTKPAAAKPSKPAPAPAKKKKSGDSSSKTASSGATSKKQTKPVAPTDKPSDKPADTPPAETPVAAASEAPPAAPPAVGDLPFGTPVMGRKGYVRSPYAEDQGMVDVTDIPAGAKVKCPFTGKVFRVP